MMARLTYTPDAEAYFQYYENQAGGDLPRFHGGQHGYGLGSMIRSLIRRIIPLGSRIVKKAAPIARRAIAIAKPHMEEAVSELAREAGKKIAATWIVDKEQQGGRRKSTRRGTRVRRQPPIKLKRSRSDFIPDIF
jgi:hypothetical protein